MLPGTRKRPGTYSPWASRNLPDESFIGRIVSYRDLYQERMRDGGPKTEFETRGAGVPWEQGGRGGGREWNGRGRVVRFGELTTFLDSTTSTVSIPPMKSNSNNDIDINMGIDNSSCALQTRKTDGMTATKPPIPAACSLFRRRAINTNTDCGVQELLLRFPIAQKNVSVTAAVLQHR